jgi:hypothetical protein
MRVQRFRAAGMAERDGAAIGAARADVHHRAVRRRDDRRTGGGGEVHALVHAGEPQHGVLAHAEARRDARPVERRAEEVAPEAAPVAVEPFRAVGGVVAPDGQVAAGHPEGGVQHLAIAQEAAGVGAVTLEKDREVVAGTELPLEVEFVAEDPDQVMGEGLGHAPRQQGLEEGSLDAGLDQDEVLAVVARERCVAARRRQGGDGAAGGDESRSGARTPLPRGLLPFE